MILLQCLDINENPGQTNEIVDFITYDRKSFVDVKIAPSPFSLPPSLASTISDASQAANQDVQEGVVSIEDLKNLKTNLILIISCTRDYINYMVSIVKTVSFPQLLCDEQ